jgi:hypothetical protein
VLFTWNWNIIDTVIKLKLLKKDPLCVASIMYCNRITQHKRGKFQAAKDLLPSSVKLAIAIATEVAL